MPPGPNRMAIAFYQHCWEFIRDDIHSMFMEFHENKLDIGRINYRVITLLPKIKNVNKIQ